MYSGPDFKLVHSTNPNDVSGAALTNAHKAGSLSNDSKGGAVSNQGQLEFMGDTVFIGTLEVCMRENELLVRALIVACSK